MPKYSEYDIEWNWYLLSCEEIPLNYKDRIKELEWHFNIMSVIDYVCAIGLEHCAMNLN